MSEGNNNNSRRSILGDITNRVDKKRGFLEKGFSDKDRFKRRRPCTEISSLKGNFVSSISKVPNPIRDYSQSELIPTDLEEADGCVKLDLLKEDLTLSTSVGENVGTNDSRLLDLSIGNAQFHDVEANKELGGGFLEGKELGDSGGCGVHDGKSLDAGEAEAVVECVESDVSESQKDDAYELNEEAFVLSQSGSIDGTFLPESQESRVFGVERSTHLKKGDECVDLNGGFDSIKACSCSFCSKAASIWLDLNYQDTRGRVSAIKKSQKEAIILAERSSRSKATGVENLTRVANLDSNLKYRWRSLFQHMADIWEKEANQLEASLRPLSDLREKCKTDLESFNAAPSDKH